MIKSSYVLALVLLVGVGCGSSEKETPNGFKYTVLKAGNGESAKKGEFLVFDFEMKDSKDSVWNSSYKEGLPIGISMPDTMGMKKEDGLTQMLRQVTKGDSVRASMSVPEFFKKLVNRPVPPTIDSTMSIIYTINVRDVMPQEEYEKWRNKLVGDRDQKIIEKYLADNNIKAERDTSGLYYVIHNTTGNPKATAESCVEVKYEGKFMRDGQTFDKNENIAFPLTGVIKGWTIGVSKLGKGDSATLYIPSSLGYGPGGYYSIPPDAVLMFNVRLNEVKTTFDDATRTCK